MNFFKTSTEALENLNNGLKGLLSCPWGYLVVLKYSDIIEDFNENGYGSALRMIQDADVKAYKTHEREEEKEKTMSKSYLALFNARDKAILRNVPVQYKLTDGGIEDYVEKQGFKKTLQMIKDM